MAFVAFRRFSQRQRLEGKLRPGQELRPSPEVGWNAAPGLSSKARNTTPTRTLGDPVIRAAQGKAASARPPFSSSINGMTTIRTLTQRRRLECCLRRTPFFRPLSAENKMASRGLLSWLRLSVCRSFCALNSFGKERTSRAWHYPSSPPV